MSSGDSQAGSELYDLLSKELGAIAEGQFWQARIDPHTLQPTALVNEAWIRLVGASEGIRDRTHFLARSARAMRSVLVDHDRRKQSAKRGGGHVRISLDEASLLQVGQDTDLLALDDALERLASRSERGDGAYHKQVAIKLVQRGLATDDLMRRFEVERRILAWLEHPCIAHLVDGGVCPDGRPFLVMEFIDGSARGRTRGTGGAI